MMTVTRFAPSPTGYLHLGHAYSALQGWQAARHDGGRFLLRLEDIDQTRCRDLYAAAILEDLAWLGLAWDEPVRRQSEHFGDYQQALDRLEAKGVLYPCFCTRREIAIEIGRAGAAPQGDAAPRYPGTCRRLGSAQRAAMRRSGRNYALRLDLEGASELAGPLDWVEEGGGAQHRVRADPTAQGDVVLARKDCPASYHLASTLDDAIQGVTLVTRGADLMPATHIHRVLQALLDLPTPRYRHHPLLKDAGGRRLAKRDGAPTIRAMRAAGANPAAILEKAQSSCR
jgi:glutamyl-Q tRNA(Asp) synthetase